jgi:hypothetical protein
LTSGGKLSEMNRIRTFLSCFEPKKLLAGTPTMAVLLVYFE